ncbi:MAG: hypothetical protein COA86_02765 [Kangiella sp.]|nr:MAG: hypothetical protein COA86_02765 [Kangiella sp.]
MPGLNWSRRVFTAKIETTYDVDAVPVDTDGVIAYNVEINPLQGDVQDDDVLPNGLLGGAAKFMINKTVSLDFEIDMVGHATPGTIPAASAIFRSLGLSETISVGVNVAYTLVSEGDESCTIYYFLDGHRHIITGCKGKASYSITPDGKLRLKCSMVGNYNAPTAVAFPTVTFANYQKALSTNPTTIQNFLLHGWTGDVRSIEFDTGSDIQADVLLTKRESVLAGRSSSGSIVLENPDFTSKNWFNAIDSDDVGAMSFDVNEGAGRICVISHPQVQLLEPKYGNEKNKATLTANLNIFPDRTNQLSEFTFTFS